MTNPLLIANMVKFYEKGLLFGASVTVTTQNVNEVVSAEFIDTLAARGRKLVVLVEYMPVTEESQELAPEEDERTILKEGIAELRHDYGKMAFVSFPGDGKNSGGCIAAGRGFSISILTAARTLSVLTIFRYQCARYLTAGGVEIRFIYGFAGW